MKKPLLILAAAITLLAGNSFAQYSAATWTGPWILSDGSTIQNYVIFDGVSAISEAGVPGASGGQGSYAVTNSGTGATSGTILYAGFTVPFAGNLTTDSTFSGLVAGSVAITFTKIKNKAIMEGTYDGTVVQTSGGSGNQTVNFTVDTNGDIVSSTNLTGPISGKLFYSNGKVTGLLKSGSSTPFNEIEVNLTGYTGSNSLAGIAVLNGSGMAGTFSFTKSVTTSVPATEGLTLSVYPNPTIDQVVIEGNTLLNGNIKIFNIVGDEIANSVLNANRTVISTKTLQLSAGVYFYSISSNGETAKQGKLIVE
jgi:hypothetical protein